MLRMRSLFASAALLLAAACGQQQEEDPAEPVAAGAQLVGWSQVAPESVFVADGVAYAVAGDVASISNVPADASPTGQTGAVSVRLPDEFEQQASGGRVRVTVRASAAEPQAMLGVVYSTADVGNSGWQQFALTPTPTDFTLEYDVPAMAAGRGDFIGFRSYTSGVQVHGYKVEVIPAA